MNKLNLIGARLKAWARKHWIISALVLIYALWSGLWSLMFTPIRNPWPQEAFTIRGRFPFDKGFELMFNQHVFGAAEWHQRLCGGGIFYLLGVDTSSATCSAGKVWTKPRQIDGQHYEVTLYRDVYFAGPQDWTASTWHTQYKANVGVDYTKVLVTSYGAPENSACSDSDERLRLFENSLFCMPQKEHGKFKNLTITEGQPAGPKERIQNFWLYSELEQMLRKQP